MGLDERNSEESIGRLSVSEPSVLETFGTYLVLVFLFVAIIISSALRHSDKAEHGPHRKGVKT